MIDRACSLPAKGWPVGHPFFVFGAKLVAHSALPTMPPRRTLLSTALILSIGTWLPARADLVEVIAAAKPAVVAVGVFNATASPRFSPRGTGFVIGDGRQVVTSLHVLPAAAESQFADELRVRIVSGAAAPSERVATLVASDRARDLALLRIEGPGLPALRLGPAELVPEGTAVALIGFPVGAVLGLVPVTHRGIVAAVTPALLPPPDARRLSGRGLLTLRQGAEAIYQLDATAYPGNSGGPLIDIRSGEVIGVVNMVLVKNTKESALTHPTGISYAVPVRAVRELIEPSR